MKKLIVTIAIAVAAVACCEAPKTLNNPIVGEVFDASMNNVSIVAGNDTLNFSTMELRDAGKDLGVFIGDSISVAYAAFEGEQASPNYFNATEMTLVYRNPIYYIVGEWVEPISIQPTANQGFVFNADGTASTVGMATLECSKWVLDGNNLTLTMTSKGVKNPSTSDVTYTVKTLDSDSLVLCEGDFRVFNLAHPAAVAL